MIKIEANFLIDLLKKPEQALYLAASEGLYELSEELIRNGSDVNKKWDDDGTTPLHAAAVAGNAKIVFLLINKGANVRTVDNFGYEPLHYAASEGHQEIINLLIAYGAKTDVKNNSGLGPADLAHKGKYRRIAKQLLQHTT